MSDKKEFKVFTMQAEIDLLAAFKLVCQSNDETQSQVVRRLMRQYIDANEQPEILPKS